MAYKDFLNSEHEKHLIELINLNEPLEDKLENAIYFFQKIISKYKIEDYVECLSSFFVEEFLDLNSRLSSFFFMELFRLRAPDYSGNDENEKNYVILPALTLVKLKEKGFDIDKIIGGFLQLDHEGDMGYQISQIIDYLLENGYIETQGLISILKNILINDYASIVRVGRLLGILIEFNILKINPTKEIIQAISNDLKLNIKQITEILIGVNKANSSKVVGICLIESILKLNNPDLKFLDDQTYISDQATGLAIIISNYLYDNKPLSHLINLFLKTDAIPVLAEAFKYLIDNSVINIKRLGLLLCNEFSNRKLDYGLLASLISTNFSYSEISKLLATILGNDDYSLNVESFIEILNGFYNHRYHGYNDSDLKLILANLQQINPELLNILEVQDFDEFFVKLKSSRKI